MNRKKEIAKYLVADYIASALTWTLFWSFRKFYIESHKFGINAPFDANAKFYLSALLVIPAFWIFIYAMAGLYANVYHKSRIAEVKQLITTSTIGVVILFFTLLIHEEVENYKSYYTTAAVLFGLQFFISSVLHFLITTSTNKKVHARKIGFNTILVGSNKKAYDLFVEMEGQRRSAGNMFVGFVHVNNSNGASAQLSQRLAHLGDFENIKNVILQKNVEEVIIAIESSEHGHIENIIYTLDRCNVVIKIIPDMYDIVTGSVRLTSLIDAPLIVISRDILHPRQRFFKRAFDIVMSFFILVIFSPVYLIIGIIIKLTSKGPVIYRQERVGLNEKPFIINKFRSMYVDAEKNGPALSSDNDSRITRFGKFLRRTRLDEFPQFYNVLIGNMSIVGPRPERRFYMEQIMKRTPHYGNLTKVKPGITSWGQVKYGYAENVDQMLDRMKYDLLYIENISLMLDLRIIIYTVLIVFQGRGK